jgi:AcrR family transcriptional regulator
MAAGTKTKPQATKRGNQRRRSILEAFHECVIEKGYAKTSLQDIATRADLYPSHVLYYFEGKEAIFEQYFENMAVRILKDLDSYRKETVERQIELLVKLYFSGRTIDHSEIGFMLESFGVAVNDPVLRREKSRVDRECKAYLTELFQESPRGAIRSAKDSAELAYSLLIGLRTAVYFDDKLKLTKARKLFRDSMYLYCGLEKK